jgi:dipeptidase
VSIFHPTSLFEVIPDKTFDGKSLWWRHELIHRRIIKNYQSLKNEYQLERDEIEKQFINHTNGITNDHDIAEFSVKASEIVENFLERWINLTAEKDSHSHNRFLYKSAWNGFNKSARITL